MRHNHRDAQHRAKRNGTKGFDVVKMNDDIYTLRRNVMTVIYDIKAIYPNIPRQVIRIVERNADDSHEGWHQVCGYAGLGDNFIHITKKWSKIDRYIYELVAHELVHAVTGFEHDDKCPLMSPCLGSVPMTKDAVDKCLGKYLKRYK